MYKNSYYASSILLIIICASYLISVIVQHPIVGMKIEPVGDNTCKVIELYPYGWAKYNSITNNDLIYCKKDISNPAYKLEKIEEITIIDGSQKYTKIVSYKGLPFSVLILNFIHIIYFCISLVIASILYLKNRDNKQYRVISFLILLISLSYLSSGVSARGDSFGIFIIVLSLWLIPIVLIDYINTMIPKETKWFKTKMVYILTIATALINIIYFNEVIFISIFFVLVSLLIIYFYKKYKFIKKDINFIKLKLNFWAIIISLFPFVFLSAIPNLFFNRQIVSFEYTALFLLLIPLSFVYISVQKVFYDFEYLLKKLIVNFLLSLTIVIILVSFLYLKLDDGLYLFQFSLISVVIIVLLLFLKDYFFTSVYSKHKKIHDSLTKFSQNTSQIKNSEDLFFYVTKEIRNVLDVAYVKYVKYHYSSDIFCVSEAMNEHILLQVQKKCHDKDINVGELISLEDGYAILTGKNDIVYDILLLSFKRNTTKLNNEEIEWLTTLCIYTNLLLENLKKTEELLSEVYNASISNHSTTVSRLLILLGEKERSKLAQDIHDSILQELIFLYKKLEILQSSNNVNTESVEIIKKQLYEQISFIRETCYDLNPPFLQEIGLIDSLSTLFNKYIEAGDFEIFFQVDREEYYSTLDQEILTSLYRIVQELMANAKKHSNAKCIFIRLSLINGCLALLYEDDGVGFNSNTLLTNKNHFGLSTMQERIKSLNGELAINSAPDQGTIIKVMININ